MFVFGNEKEVVNNVSDDDKKIIEAVSAFMGIMFRLNTELPLSKSYNKLSETFSSSFKVQYIVQCLYN